MPRFSWIDAQRNIQNNREEGIRTREEALNLVEYAERVALTKAFQGDGNGRIRELFRIARQLQGDLWSPQALEVYKLLEQCKANLQPEEEQEEEEEEHPAPTRRPPERTKPTPQSNPSGEELYTIKKTEHLSYKEIGERVGLTEAAVVWRITRYRNHHGLPPFNTRGAGLTGEDLYTIKKTEGLTYKELAERTGLTEATVVQRVKRHWRKHSLPNFDRGNGLTGEDLYTIKKEQGLTDKQLAELTGLPKNGVTQRIWKYRQQHNLPGFHARRTGLTGEDLYTIKKAEGLTDRMVSERTGYTINTVREKMRVFRRESGLPDFSPDAGGPAGKDLYEMKRAEGLTFRELGRRCGLKPGTVEDRVDRHRKRHSLPAFIGKGPTGKELFNLKRREGLMGKELAARFDIPETVVMSRIGSFRKKHGIPAGCWQVLSGKSLYHMVKQQHVKFAYRMVAHLTGLPVDIILDRIRTYKKQYRVRESDADLFWMRGELGLSLDRIARRTGVPLHEVKARLSRYRESLGLMGYSRKVTDEELYNLRRQGYTYDQVREITGLRGVKKKVKRYAWELTHQRERERLSNHPGKIVAHVDPSMSVEGRLGYVVEP